MKRRESGPRGHRKLGPGLATLGAGFVAVTLSAPAVAGGNRDMTEAKPTPVIAQPSAATGSDDWLARVWSALTSIQLAATSEEDAFDAVVDFPTEEAARAFLEAYPGTTRLAELLDALPLDVALAVCDGDASDACRAFVEKFVTGAGTPAGEGTDDGGGGTGNIPGIS